MRSILVVEDDPALLEAIADVAEAAGHHVTRAQDGDEGLAMARKVKPELILSGYMMPKMDGLALQKALRLDKRLCAIPFVLLSALPRPAALPESVTFMRKPFEIEAFVAMIDRELAQSPDDR